MKKVAIKAGVFAFVSMAVMLHRSLTKHILITDAALSDVDRGSGEIVSELLIDRNVPEGKEDALIIPLPGSVSSDNIILEDRYIDHELSILINGREKDFYKSTPIAFDLDLIDSAECITGADSESVRLDFKLDGVYANESTLTDNNTIEVRFFKPSDRYSDIVVVDADSEMGLASMVSRFLKEASEKDKEHSIRIYYTGLSQDETFDKKVALIRDCGACMVLRLTEDDSLEAGSISSFYNGDFFLRRLSNAELADTILKSCASQGQGQAVGAFEASEDPLLDCLKIPAAGIRFGYASSGEDAENAVNEVYLKRVAEGLYNGIISALEVMR